MTGSQWIYATRWLIRDTFRQALATRVFWVMLALTVLCIVFCLGVSVEGGLAPHEPGDTERYTAENKPFIGHNPAPARMRLLYGAMAVEVPRDPQTGVHMLQALLATWVAGSAGLLLALVWTAGFVPETLQPSAASVLFAKPVPRGAVLVGKYLGVVAFVAFQALLFFLGTWLALGLRTGVWLPSYLAGVPVLVLHFATIYAFSVLLGVYTRSTAACIVGTVLFWLVCWGIGLGRHYALALPDLAPRAEPLSPLTTILAEVGYWVLPKPADLVVGLEQTLQIGQHFAGPSSWEMFEVVGRRGALVMELSLLTSLLSAAAMLALAGHQLKTTDY